MTMVAPLSGEGTDEHIHFIVRVHQAHMTYQHLLAIWRAADGLGYDGASLYDLLAALCLVCWTTLTMLTMETRSIRAIPMVLSHTYRHPTVLAKMAATLDRVSGGRLMLGLGAGGSQRDHEASGIPWRPLQERLAFALVGTPEQCVARLQAYVTLGIRTFFLVFPDLPDLDSLMLFAAKVLPAFRSGRP